MTVFVLPNTCCREWVNIPQRASFFLYSAFLVQGSLAQSSKSLARNSESLSHCKGPWITGVEERSKIPSTEKRAAPQHKPGQEGLMLESTTREESSGMRVPTDPWVELPAPDRHLARHPTSKNFIYNTASESHFWWQLSYFQHILYQFCHPELTQSQRQTFSMLETPLEIDE